METAVATDSAWSLALPEDEMGAEEVAGKSDGAGEFAEVVVVVLAAPSASPPTVRDRDIFSTRVIAWREVRERRS